MKTKFYMLITEDYNKLIAVQEHHCYEEEKEIKLALVLPSENGFFKDIDLYSDTVIADVKRWIQTLSEKTHLEVFGEGNDFVDFNTIDGTLAEIGEADVDSYYITWWFFEYTKKEEEIYINPRKEINNMYESLRRWDKGETVGRSYGTSWRIKIGYDHWITIGMTYHEADGYNDAYVDGDVYFIFRGERVKPCPADKAVDVFTNEAIKIYNEQLDLKKQGKIYF